MKKLFLFLVVFCFILISNANNIKVQNTSLTNIHQDQGWIQIETSISWDNSWLINTGTSAPQWDAAWVFVKYRVNNTGRWRHATLNQNNNVAPPGSIIDVSSDNLGAFVHRDAVGTGFFEVNNLRLRWDYIADGINPTDIVKVRVFAIEMVLVPQGPFYLGAGTPTNGGGVGPNEEVNMFGSGGLGVNDTTRTPYIITSETQITVSDTPGDIYYGNDTPNGGDQTGVISGGYPKGYNAFYCMKYEVSEQQWIDFFNSLTDAQKVNNDLTGPEGKNSDAVVNRNTISWLGGSEEAATTQAPTRAVNFISFNFANNYLSWTALRFMTEFEYEKASRGPNVPVRSEFAWARPIVSSNIYNLNNDGAFNENILNPSTTEGNASYDITDDNKNGPLRCGIFASSAVTSTRKESGSSYYGIMELSGNLSERCITVGTITGRNYGGQHGDGSLSTSGTSSIFPNVDAQGFRGGSFFDDKNRLRTSDRAQATYNNTLGLKQFGLRGVRTAL